jgi:hypothetical protein
MDVTDVTLQHVEPMLCNTSQVKCSNFHFLVVAGVLNPNEVLTSIQPTQWIVSTIECGK